MMGRNRGGVFSRFIEDLADGDPVAVTALVVLLVIFAGLALFALKIHRDLKREDDAKANRWKK